MQSQKFSDFFLVSATLLAVTIPSFTSPAIAMKFLSKLTTIVRS